MRVRVAWAPAVLALGCFGLVPGVPAESVEGAGLAPEGASRTTLVTVSPLFGWVRNEREVRGERGHVSTSSDTAPMYGFFAMAGHGAFVLTDYVFFSEVNDTDVWGNLAYLNWYGDRRARFSWNVGVGHLYHKIKPANEEITVNVPMVKTGPLVNIPEWNLSLNPYVGYAWERIETRRADLDNDSTLYGINIGWRRRMLGATLQYYYQDSRDPGKDYHTLRVRAHALFTRRWGATVRFDYMEHYGSDDLSVQFGPVYVFGGMTGGSFQAGSP